MAVNENWLPFLLLLAVCLGCTPATRNLQDQNVTPAPAPSGPAKQANLFDPAEVCLYPRQVSDPQMHSLAGGEWKEMIVEGESLGYGCMSGRSSQREVKLFNDGSAIAQIEYAVDGEESGGKYIVVDYYVDLSASVPVEAKYRQQYIRFVSELSKLILGKEASKPFIGKIADLKSYGPSGSPSKFEERVGAGRIELSFAKGPPGGTIFAKTYFYPY